jgi:SAM-dependent methyltransferase
MDFKMNLKSFMQKKIKQDGFYPGIVSFLFSTSFLRRRDLLNSIKNNSKYIGGHVLDVGSGDKPYQQLFKYKKYVGLDTEKSGHDHKEETIDVLYDGKNFPFKEASFDSILSFEVLEHVEDLDLMISEMARVLKKNGKLLITTPFIWNLHEEPYDFRRLTPYGLINIFEKNNFKIKKIEKISNDYSIIFQIMQLYLQEGTFHKNYLTRIFITPIICFYNLLGILSKIFPKTEKIYGGNLIVATKK